MCWHSCGFNPAGRTNGRERRGSRATVNNKLIKTLKTDIKDGKNHKETDRDREREQRKCGLREEWRQIWM